MSRSSLRYMGQFSTVGIFFERLVCAREVAHVLSIAVVIWYGKMDGQKSTRNRRCCRGASARAAMEGLQTAV